MSQAWNPEQVDFIRLCYPSFTNPELATYLGCTISRLEAFGRRHSLHKLKHAGNSFLPLELTGEKYGYLLVIEKTGKKEKNNYLWRCKCDCGKTVNVRASSLRHNKVKSCGCQTDYRYGQRHHRRTGAGKISGTWWSKFLSHANERGIKVEVTAQQIWELFERQNSRCALSGVILFFPDKFKENTATASLDRIDSSQPYTLDNLQWVHKRVNEMKNKHNQSEFLDWCATITDFQRT